MKKNDKQKLPRICFSCGQPKREDLVLTHAEKEKLDSLMHDWRAYYKYLLEIADSEKQQARRKLAELIGEDL